MTTKDLFYCKDGSLTDYALSCDYVHRLKINNEWIELKKIYSIYEIDGFNYETYKHFCQKGFEKLTDAKKYFFQQCKRKYNLTKKEVIKKTTHLL